MKNNMQLIRDVKGISKLIFILLLLVSFIVGALFSYIWTMGYYAPLEFHLPSQSSVAIESVEFFAENTGLFNVTLINPSYSPSNVTIEHIMVSTNNSLLHNVTGTLPPLPQVLAPGNSQTFSVAWDWGSYTGQTLSIIAIVSGGSGAAFQTRTPG